MSFRTLSAESRGASLDDVDRAPPREGLRSISWEEAAMILAIDPPTIRRSSHGLWVMSGGNRFVHYVPPPLRHVGCMWLEDGYEDRRCGRRPAWTMGRDLQLARLYCEEHGLMILARRAETRARKKRPRNTGSRASRARR